MKNKNLNYKIDPKKFVSPLVVISVVLIIVNTLLHIIQYQFGFSKTIFEEFFLDEENNIPTYFATFILLISSLLLMLIGMYHKKSNGKNRFYWNFLSIIFLVLSIDEMSALHERLIYYVRILLNPSGFFYFGWLIPALAMVIILSIVYLKFFLQLPKKTKYSFLLAAILYLMGVFVLEAIGGNFFESFGGDNLSYAMITTVEETLEMAGVIVFIYALLDYMRNENIQYVFGEKPELNTEENKIA